MIGGFIAGFRESTEQTLC